MLTVHECTSKAGLDVALMPGEVQYRPIIGEKEGTSYTLKYDHKDPHIVKMEVIPGLTGKALDPKELRNCAVWLQTPSAIELEVRSGNITDARGTLLGKKVAGEEVIDKITDFFGALATHAVGRALELALAAANLAKQILPTLTTKPFANEFTGRTMAFARAAAGRVTPKAAPQLAMAPSSPGLGLGGSARTTRVPGTSEEQARTVPATSEEEA